MERKKEEEGEEGRKGKGRSGEKDATNLGCGLSFFFFCSSVPLFGRVFLFTLCSRAGSLFLLISTTSSRTHHMDSLTRTPAAPWSALNQEETRKATERNNEYVRMLPGSWTGFLFFARPCTHVFNGGSFIQLTRNTHALSLPLLPL